MSRARLLPIASCALASVALGAGFVTSPRRALFAYLVAWCFWFTVAAGAVMFGLVAELTSASWAVAFRRVLEALGLSLPLLALLFVPIAIGASRLYPWAADASTWSPALAEAIEKKRGYLSYEFWCVRAALWLAIWCGFVLCTRRWSLQGDAGTDPRTKRRVLAALAAPALGLSLTFASFDWMMSLDPSWVSNAYGLYVFSGAFLAGLAAIAVFAGVLQPPGLRAAHFHALAKAMLAMTVFWAYLAVAPMIIVWSANLPEEVTFYVVRSEHGWNVVTWVLVVVQFAVPFLALLLRHFTQRRGYVIGVACVLMAAHYIDMFWLLVPECDRASCRASWLDLAALIALGSACWVWAQARFAAAAPIPLAEPLHTRTLEYRG